MVWQESIRSLPKPNVPPDPERGLVPCPPASTTITRKLKEALEPTTIANDTIIGVREFERSLAKPSNIPSLAGAENLKNIIEGKYSCLSYSPPPLSFSAGYQDGPYPTLKTQLTSDHIKTADVTPSIPELTIFPLPPCPQYPPLPRPSSDTTVDNIHAGLPAIIEKLLQTKSKLHPPLFRFEISEEAAAYNYNIIHNNQFKLNKLLNPSKQSFTNYGSEFKSTKDLEPLFKYHPRWKQLKSRLEHGVHFPLLPLDETIRQQDVKQAYIRGNHKSAIKHESYLSSAMEKEVLKGWNIILPDDKFDKIPDLILNPMGVADHLGISAFGEFIEKLRITHDLSFPGATSQESVNSRIIEDDDMEPCMFGHTLLRVIHYIVNLRSRHPDKKIWIRKEDLKSAYRRMHIDSPSAFASAVRVKLKQTWYILLSMRLPFGGSSCPREFCILSDLLADLINDLLSCKEWDETKIRSNYVTKIPAPVEMDQAIPFARSRELIVSLPIEDHGKSDVFIDDLISVAVDLNNNLKRLSAAPCTVIHAVAHEAESGSHVKRDNMIADDKNDAEGAPEESKICLGWLLDTRKLLVSLPFHKATAWSNQIENMMLQKSVSEKLLASVLGRLENIATIMPMMGHFFNNIRFLQTKADQGKHNVSLTRRAKEDLKLCLKFIHRAQQGVSMNLLTFRSPNIVHIGDASEHGLGSFASHGRAWRFIIPEKLRGRAHINLLEFLTQVVSVWIDIIEQKSSKEDCILCMGDSTSAIGWLRRSNFRAKDENDTEWEVKQTVARKLADLVLDSNTVLYKQWFAGELNVVADSLSRDGYYLDSNTHTTFLNSTVPQQLPHSFHISPVPTDICSFIISTLEQLPVKKHRLIPQKPSELALGNAGMLLSLASGSLPRCFSTTSQDFNKTSSSLPLPKQCESVLSHQNLLNIWLKERSVPPSHMWHRPSGQVIGKTPDWTETVKLASYYKNSSEVTKTKTDKRRNKRHCQ